jgi:hypothetical protein
MNTRQLALAEQAFDKIVDLARNKDNIDQSEFWTQGTWVTIKDTDEDGNEKFYYESGEEIENRPSIPDQMQTHPCGTAACYAGWVALLEIQNKNNIGGVKSFIRGLLAVKKASPKLYLGISGADKYCKRILGWTEEAGCSEDEIFSGSNSLRTIREHLNDIREAYGYERREVENLEDT